MNPKILLDFPYPCDVETLLDMQRLVGIIGQWALRRIELKGYFAFLCYVSARENYLAINFCPAGKLGSTFSFRTFGTNSLSENELTDAEGLLDTLYKEACAAQNLGQTTHIR